MRLYRGLYNASDLLENRWIARIEELETQGRYCGDSEYDDACANLCAVAYEFWIWKEE